MLKAMNQSLHLKQLYMPLPLGWAIKFYPHPYLGASLNFHQRFLGGEPLFPIFQFCIIFSFKATSFANIYSILVVRPNK